MRFIGVILTVVMLALPAAPAQAHPADMYFHVHTIRLHPDGVQAKWGISPGSLLAYYIWEQADADGNGAVSTDEARAWGEPLIEDYFAVLGDSLRLTWRLESVDWPDALIDFESGDQMIQLHLAADWPAGVGDNPNLIIYNRYQENNSVNWFYVHGDDGVTFHTPQQQSGALIFDFALPDTPAAGDLRAYWDSGTPALAASEASIPAAPPEQDRGASGQLIDLVREGDLTLPFYMSALVIALGLGAIHALTPGHGKTLVGAYLVGSRGTMRHAVVLGSIVTLTHTGSVLTIGLLTLVASRYLMPTTLFPYLELASGLLVIAMGIGLLSRRFGGFQSVRKARQRQQAPLPPAPPSPAPAPASGQRQTIYINQPINANVYNDVLPDRLALNTIRWRSLVTLGISGGMVPCPDAIAILLVAVAINRIVFGLSLIVAFSLGLALVLMAIGMAMVRSQRLLAGRDLFDRVMPAMPMISAVIVVGLGAALMVNALRDSDLLGADDESASPIADLSALANQDELEDLKVQYTRAQPDTFSIDRASILYADTDAQGIYQLYVLPLAGAEPIPITDEPYGVQDYTLSDDGTRIVYTAARQYGGTELWQVNTDSTDRTQLLACDTAICNRAALSPDGTRLVFQRLEMGQPDTPPGDFTLWWLDMTSGAAQPVFRDDRLPGGNPVWSPDGQWLSYNAAGNKQVQLYNLDDGRTHAVSSETGAAVTWGPDSEALVVTDIWDGSADGSLLVHLTRFDLATGQQVDITGDAAYGDNWPAWSPDGEWIACVRRDHTRPDAGLGDNIWRMRPDGSEAHPLTDDTGVIHGAPVWSPDGAYLLFQRYPLAGSVGVPGIWLLEVETQELQKLSASGDWPAWLP
jgi:nickel/cobalt transporter (NicO) family protein